MWMILAVVVVVLLPLFDGVSIRVQWVVLEQSPFLVMVCEISEEPVV